MALHIFNCSVDTPDFRPNGGPKDLSINDQESFVELILEQVMGIDNAIPEHDEPDDDGTCVVKVMFEHFVLPAPLVLVTHSSADKYILPIYRENFDSQFFPEIIPPPPKA